ncbi:MAG TPA: hypothetical protein VKR55_03125 [Bradyrhizobium sp.]|nr:hypothetical protein [Bradyrhizobium sp.]HLZ01125.1 hypothetical protein [Bradyrhizobium sp.]
MPASTMIVIAAVVAAFTLLAAALVWADVQTRGPRRRSRSGP